eukprot:11087721-Lingulodinium_polyedra.AAC.1
MAVKFMELSIVIYTDCKALVDVHERGQEWCLMHDRACANVWAFYWREVGLKDGASIAVVKVVAHATEKDVQSGRITQAQRCGN